MESRETFNLAVTSSSLPNNVYHGVPNVTTVTILDDEGTFYLELIAVLAIYEANKYCSVGTKVAVVLCLAIELDH